MSPPPQAISELEIAMEALSLVEGHPTRAQLAQAVQCETAQIAQGFRQKAKKNVIRPVMRIVDEFNQRDSEHVSARPQAYDTMFDDIAVIFRELGGAVMAEQTVIMGLLGDLEGQRTESNVWMATREGDKNHGVQVRDLARSLIAKLSTADSWTEMSKSQRVGLVQDSAVLSNVLEAFEAAADLAREVFEREMDRCYMAISILSGHRETLDIVRAAGTAAVGSRG